MEKDRKNFIFWVKEHKTELLIAGISIAALVILIFGIKNKDVLMETWKSLEKSVEGITSKKVRTCQNVKIEVAPAEKITIVNIVASTKAPHEVCEHLRNLPEGWSASTAKQMEALKHGYVLGPGQTWVNTYRTGCHVA